MEPSHLSAELTVASMLARWPQTISIFFGHRMDCVVCPIAHLATLDDVARIYGLDLKRFLGELEQAIKLKEEAPESFLG